MTERITMQFHCFATFKRKQRMGNVELELIILISEIEYFFLLVCKKDILRIKKVSQNFAFSLLKEVYATLFQITNKQQTYFISET